MIVPRAVSARRLLSSSSLAACGLTTAGDAYCWGLNYDGRLGTGADPDPANGMFAHPMPGAVVGGHKFTAISLSAEHTCALGTGGDIYCWGDGTGGALGVDPATLPTCSNGSWDFPCSTTPMRLPSTQVFTAVSAGLYTTCALTSTGQLYYWGGNEWGQVGDGTVTPTWTPVEIPVPAAPVTP